MNKEEFQGGFSETLRKCLYMSIEFSDIEYGTMRVDFKNGFEHKYSITIEYIIKKGDIKVTDIYLPNLKVKLNFLISKVEEYMDPKLHTTKESLYTMEKYSRSIHTIREEVEALAFIGFKFSMTRELGYLTNILDKYTDKIFPIVDRIMSLINDSNKELSK